MSLKNYGWALSYSTMLAQARLIAVVRRLHKSADITVNLADSPLASKVDNLERNRTYQVSTVIIVRANMKRQ
jgi:hypothetical protein